MAWFREVVRRLSGTVGWGRSDLDLQEELRLHAEMAAESARRAGESPLEAARAAAIRHGGITQALEAQQAQRGLRWASDLSRDVRYGLRGLRRSPLFASVALVTLGLGIGANTAIFTLADAVLFRALPVAAPRELVVLRQHLLTGDMWPFTSKAAADLAESPDVLSGLAVFRPRLDVPVSVKGESELALMQAVSGNYHAVLGVHAAVGRTLTAEDREPVAVISYRYWQRRFARDPGVVGHVLQVHDQAFTIVGVTPAEFFGTQPGRYVDVTVPLATQPQLRPNARWLYLLGRLAPGVSRERARSALQVRWSQIAAAQTPPSGLPPTLELDSGAQGLNELRRQFSVPLRILMATVGIVLLVACANLAGLLVVRSGARQEEIALRRSLGATRGRIARQLLTESALLATAGGVAGVAVAYSMTTLLLAMMSRGRAEIILDVTPNATTLGFTIVVTVVTTALLGLLPAVRGSRTRVQPLHNRGSEGDRAGIRWGLGLVAVQVALVVPLLSSAGLFTRTLQKLRAVDAGFQQEQVLVVRMAPGIAFRGGVRALYDQLYERFGALPGVRSVSAAMDTPGHGLSMAAGMAVAGRPNDEADAAPVYHNFVGPGFFQTMGIPILAGRDFEPGDDERAGRRVVISESVARRYFGGEDPLGRQIQVGSVGGQTTGTSTASIVGVVKDVRYESLRAAAPLMLYRAFRQEANAPANTFIVRASSTNADSLTPLLLAELRRTAPGMPLPAVVRLDDEIAAVLVEERMLTALSNGISLLAVLLAAIGVYSTVASAVARRRREIGIRIAIGALPNQVTRMVVRDAFGILAFGLVIGLAVALVVGRAAHDTLSSVLFGLSPTDPLVFLTSAAAVCLIGSIAAYLPAQRASRIDPVSAIKYE